MTVAILVLVVIVVACKFICDSKNHIMGMLLFTTIFYFLLIAFGVKVIISRHLYSIYPSIAILTVWIIGSIIKYLSLVKFIEAIMGILCVIISFAGVLTQEIEYLYPERGYPIFVAQYNHELSAIFLADLGYETFSNYFELGEYDSSAVVKYENPTMIRDLLEEKASPDQFILYVINDQKGMDSVSEAEYKELYSYNGNVCYLLSK